jgi:hypothetical protein
MWVGILIDIRVHNGLQQHRLSMQALVLPTSELILTLQLREAHTAKSVCDLQPH